MRARKVHVDELGLKYVVRRVELIPEASAAVDRLAAARDVAPGEVLEGLITVGMLAGGGAPTAPDEDRLTVVLKTEELRMLKAIGDAIGRGTRDVAHLLLARALGGTAAAIAGKRATDAVPSAAAGDAPRATFATAAGGAAVGLSDLFTSLETLSVRIVEEGDELFGDASRAGHHAARLVALAEAMQTGARDVADMTLEAERSRPS